MERTNGPGLLGTIVITVLVLIVATWFLRVVLKLVALVTGAIVLGLLALIVVGVVRTSRRG